MKLGYRAGALGIVVGLLAVGCGSSANEGPSASTMSDPAVIASVNAKLGPVKSAFERPTGVVEAGSMADVVASMNSSESRSAMVPTSPFGMAAGASSPEAKPLTLWPLDRGFRACGSYSAGAVTIDMTCIDDDYTSGTMVMRTVPLQGGGGYSAMTNIENICRKPEADGTGGECMNGELFMEQSGTTTSYTMTMLMDVVVTSNGASTHERAATRMRYDGASFAIDIVTFDGEASYVITQTSDGITVVGSNGRFDCTYTDAGKHGTCRSSSDEEWSW